MKTFILAIVLILPACTSITYKGTNADGSVTEISGFDLWHDVIANDLHAKLTGKDGVTRQFDLGSMTSDQTKGLIEFIKVWPVISKALAEGTVEGLK